MALAEAPAEIRRRAAGVWAARATAEADAAARFGQLARDLRALDASPVVVELCERAAADEVRHRDACVALVAALGFEIATPALPALPGPASSLGAWDTALVQVVGLCCVNETMSAGVLSELLRASRGVPEVHAVVQGILRDEVEHARVGWAHLADAAGRGDVAVVAAALPHLLEDAVTDELFAGPEVHDPLHGLEAWGGLPRATRRAALEAALRDLVFPGLERFGVDTAAGRRWLRAHL